MANAGRLIMSNVSNPALSTLFACTGECQSRAPRGKYNLQIEILRTYIHAKRDSNDEQLYAI
jgi:hypothetical protein